MINQINYEDIFNYCHEVNYFNRGLGDSFLHLFIKNMMNEDTARYIANRLDTFASNNNEFSSFEIVFCHYSTNGSHRDLYLEPYPGVYNDVDDYMEIEEYMPGSIVLGFYVPEFMREEEDIIKIILGKFIDAIMTVLHHAIKSNDFWYPATVEQPFEDENLGCYKSYKWHITVA